MGKLATVPISKIRENMVALRTVNQSSEEFNGLVDSIRQKGFLGAITVREKIDPQTQEGYYELIDGLHRYTAAKAAGLEEINVDINSLSDAEVMEAQILSNIHKVETRASEYSKQLQRILTMNPLMTEAELATKLAKSPSWIAERLSLNKIDNPEIRRMIDEGRINLSNAYTLAKLPDNEMVDWLERAQTDPPQKFIADVTGRLKAIKEANKQGKGAEAVAWEPQPHMRKMSELKNESETPAVGPQLVNVLKITTPEQGFQTGVMWALHMDPVSVEQAKKDYEARQKANEEKRAKAKAEREQKKAEEAKKNADAARTAAATA